LGFAELWESLLPVGRDPATGGYRRYSFTEADLACREWFTSTAADRGMPASCDRNGNLWAWWGVPGGPGGPPAEPGAAVVTGSAEPADCEAGVATLAAVLADLAGR
jgi:beta-ureidopropionase / N-carbamoyl-L-amino-acid hydrolase